jgi:hypothetical protein
MSSIVFQNREILVTNGITPMGITPMGITPMAAKLVSRFFLLVGTQPAFAADRARGLRTAALVDLVAHMRSANVW